MMRMPVRQRVVLGGAVVAAGVEQLQAALTIGAEAIGAIQIYQAGQLGPSGKPWVHKKRFSSKKKAREAAEQAGDGEPMHHPNPRRGRRHFHPTDSEGNKIPGVHYEY